MKLLELLITLALIGILAALLFPGFVSIRRAEACRDKVHVRLGTYAYYMREE